MYKILLNNVKIIREVSFPSLLYLITIKVLQGILPLINLLVLQNLINNIQNILNDDPDVLYITIYLIFAQFLLTILGSTLSKCENYLGTSIQSRVELELKKRLAKKIFSLSFHLVEDFDFQNRLQRTQGDLGSRVFMPINQVLELISSIITILSVSSFLLQFHWIFLLLIFITAVPLIKMHAKFGSDNYFLLRFQTPSAREQGYIYDMFIDRQHNKEIRLSQATDYLIDKWKSVYQKNQKEILNQEASQLKKSILMDTLNAMSFLVAGVYLIWMITHRTVKVGDFVSIIDAIQRLQGAVLLSAQLYSVIKENSMYLEDLDYILNFETSPQRSTEAFPELLHEGVKIQNFSFKYPGNPTYTLKNICLDIPANSSLIIVGENGSGKSTLIKCLMKLYPIEKNSISFENIDIANIEHSSLYSNFAVIPQDFVKYEFSLKENIMLGDIKNSSIEDFNNILNQLDIHRIGKKLRSGVNTRLGKMFEESEDLSGGQWQKIALARAMIKKSQILVLDEATSALDPESEIETFLNFRKLAENQTSIFISHRMYACHLADQIVVMKDGEIVENGSFDELINQKDHFYNLYQKQAEMYEVNKEVEV